MSEDTILETEMSATEVTISADPQHKVVVIHVNGDDLYVFTPAIARLYGEALIRAADKAEPAVKLKAVANANQQP